MIIGEDKSYLRKLDLELINKGYADLDIHSVHFEKKFSEEQKNKNKENIEKMSKQEWEIYCDNIWCEFSEKLKTIIDKLDSEYLIYQYKKDLDYIKDDWDYFFYSDRGWNKKNYFTFFELKPNSKRPLGKRLIDVNNLINFLKNQQISDDILIRIQYDIFKNEDKIKNDALNFIDKIKNTFINYNGMTGKIKIISVNENNIKYGFFKKGAKTHYYNISYPDILPLLWE